MNENIIGQEDKARLIELLTEAKTITGKYPDLKKSTTSAAIAMDHIDYALQWLNTL